MFPSLIFIDGGDPEETAKADEILKAKGFVGVQGQTTNPSLVSKNPEVQKYLASGKKLTAEEAVNEYKKIVTAIAQATSGPISIQVIADQSTKKEEMLRQAYVYRDWIPNGIIKFPCTYEGLGAAEEFCQDWSVNITLNFSQEQAAAVYLATLRRGVSPQGKPHRVFISPFIGRLDDRGENGMQVVANILKMYHNAPSQDITPPDPLLRRGGTGELSGGKNHVEVLTASVRKLDHILYALQLKSAAITIPLKIFQEWADKNFPVPPTTFTYDTGSLSPIPYREIPLDRDWRSYDLHHDLTEIGLTKFMEDWQAMLR